MWTTVLMLLVLGFHGFLGFITSNTLGGLVHILFVTAIVVMAVRLLQDRRVV